MGVNGIVLKVLVMKSLKSGLPVVPRSLKSGENRFATPSDALDRLSYLLDPLCDKLLPIDIWLIVFFFFLVGLDFFAFVFVVCMLNCFLIFISTINRNLDFIFSVL